MEAVTCPSCGSKYNTETRELVEDTKLSEKVAELQGQLQTLRTVNKTLSEDLTEANGKIAELTAAPPTPPTPPPSDRAKKERDFIVGVRD
jgi:hypothetical protein